LASGTGLHFSTPGEALRRVPLAGRACAHEPTHAMGHCLLFARSRVWTSSTSRCSIIHAARSSPIWCHPQITRFRWPRSRRGSVRDLLRDRRRRRRHRRARANRRSGYRLTPIACPTKPSRSASGMRVGRPAAIEISAHVVAPAATSLPSCTSSVRRMHDAGRHTSTKQSPPGRRHHPDLGGGERHTDTRADARRPEVPLRHRGCVAERRVELGTQVVSVRRVALEDRPARPALATASEAAPAGPAGPPTSSAASSAITASSLRRARRGRHHQDAG